MRRMNFVSQQIIAIGLERGDTRRNLRTYAHRLDFQRSHDGPGGFSTCTDDFAQPAAAKVDGQIAEEAFDQLGGSLRPERSLRPFNLSWICG